MVTKTISWGKNWLKSFRHMVLKLEIKCNLKKVGYFSIRFDLNTGSYRPYRKPNNDTRYKIGKWYHPPSILKHVLAAISKRMSINLSNKQIIQRVAPYYNNILKDCGHKEKLQFEQYQYQQTEPRKNRSWNIIWFNPPFSSNVETNIARKLLKLVKKLLSKYRYRKTFNKNNIKVSYSCTDNMEKLVKKQNNNLLRKNAQTNETVIVARIILVS